MACLRNHQAFDLSPPRIQTRNQRESWAGGADLFINPGECLNEPRRSWKSSVSEEVSLNAFCYLLRVPPGVFHLRQRWGTWGYRAEQTSGPQSGLWNEGEDRERTPGHVQEENASYSLRNLWVRREAVSCAWWFWSEKTVPENWLESICIQMQYHWAHFGWEPYTRDTVKGFFFFFLNAGSCLSVCVFWVQYPTDPVFWNRALKQIVLEASVHTYGQLKAWMYHFTCLQLAPNTLAGDAGEMVH